MVVDSELLDLSISDRFFVYAEAYCNAATALTKQMTEESNQLNWPNATVVLMLSAHAVELFLKGAIYLKDLKANVNHHNIDKLAEIYSQKYTGSTFYFDIPFKTEYPGKSDAEIKTLKNQSNFPTSSMLYRYPTATSEEEWNGAYGFEPYSFLAVLKQLTNDFSRVKKCFTE